MSANGEGLESGCTARILNEANTVARIGWKNAVEEDTHIGKVAKVEMGIE